MHANLARCGGGYIKGPNGEQGGCWAEELVSTRMSKNPKLPMYHDLAKPDGGWSGVVKLMPERLKDIVALWQSAQAQCRKEIVPAWSRVFVCDMSDLFHDKVPSIYRRGIPGQWRAPKSLVLRAHETTGAGDRILEWLGRCGRMTTEHDKPRRIIGAAYLNAYADTGIWADTAALQHDGLASPNVVFGVTVEDRRYGVPRLDLARKFPARLRWASVEPQLEDLADVDFSGFDLVVNGEKRPGRRSRC